MKATPVEPPNIPFIRANLDFPRSNYQWEGVMGVSRRDRLPVLLFIGLALLSSPMIGRTLAADAEPSPSAATRPAAGEAAPVGGKTFTPARAWKLAFATGSSSLTRGAKADSPIQLAQG